MTKETQTTETKETAPTPTNLEKEQTLNKPQQLNAIKNVFQFLSNYDRVPGNLTSSWSQILDALALVHNSIASELETTTEKPKKTKKTKTVN